MSHVLLSLSVFVGFATGACVSAPEPRAPAASAPSARSWGPPGQPANSTGPGSQSTESSDGDYAPGEASEGEWETGERRWEAGQSQWALDESEWEGGEGEWPGGEGDWEEGQGDWEEGEGEWETGDSQWAMSDSGSETDEAAEPSAPPAPASPPATAPSPPAAPSAPTGDAAFEAAAKAAGMTALERGIVLETNRLRSNPRAFRADLRAYRARYDGVLLRLPGQVAIQTFEGPAAVDEAIAAARDAEPAPALKLSAGLSRAARAHAEAIGAAGTIEHRGADGSGPYDRMARHGRVGGMSGENIGTGHDDASLMVIDLFVDDGVPSRGHRDNLLEPRYRVVGVGCAPHSRYRTVCVFDFAEAFEPRAR